jgi:hypothetical protein
MATITTTSNATPLQVPSVTLIDRDRHSGNLYALVKASTANTYEVWRYDSVTWSLYATLTRASVVEVGSIHVTNVLWLHWCYRTNEGGQDRIYWRRLNLTNATWGPEVLTGNPSNGGSPGSVHTGLDLHVVVDSGQEFVAIAAGTTVGASHGVTLYGVRVGTDGVAKYLNEGVFVGKRQWLHTGSGRITPSVDVEHTGDGKTSSAPHLWVTWGRTQVYLVKASWGWRWTTPNTAQTLTSTALTPAQDSIAGRWDGQRFIVAVPDPSITDRVMVLQRKRSGTADVTLQTPAHPAGVIRNCSLSYHHTTGNLRVYGVGTSTAVLYFVDYTRATGTWGSWAQVLATAVMGTGGNQFSVRRGTFGSARHDVYTAHTTPTPNTLVHTAQTVASPPDPPEWNTPAIGYSNGAAADVSAALVLDWVFSDPDPADVQSAFAVSRQIGAGALQYWRASDSTWQGTEQKNLSATSAITLSSGWAVATADAHTFSAKVWDAADVASGYGPPLTLIPSGKVNPTISSPTEGATITTGQVALTWTVAEQTAYKVRLEIAGAPLYDSGWITGTTLSHTIPVTLADGFSYSAFLQTKNLEGLPSNSVQRNFSVDVVPPPVASIAATPLPNPPNGYISVAVTNPAAVGTQPAFASQELWRRPLVNPILNANTSFETDTSGWLAGVGGTAARDAAVGKFGTASLRLTPNGVAASPRLESDFIPISPSTSYHLDGWVMADTTNKGVALFFHWYDAGNAFISDSAPVAVIPLAADVFLYYGPIATSPSNAAYMKICAGLTGTPAAGDRIWLDGVRVRATDGTDGVRVAKELPSGATVNDWQAVSGVSNEYRVIVFGANGAASHGPWQA